MNLNLYSFIFHQIQYFYTEISKCVIANLSDESSLVCIPLKVIFDNTLVDIFEIKISLRFKEITYRFGLHRANKHRSCIKRNKTS